MSCLHPPIRFNQPQNFLKLLSFLVEEPKESDDNDRKYKLPQISFFFLETMPQHALLNRLIGDLPRTISEDPPLRPFVGYFLSFFSKVKDYSEETQSILSGFVSRVILKVAEIKPKEILISLYFENFWVFEALSRCFFIKTLSDLFISLMLLGLKEISEEKHVKEAKVPLEHQFSFK